MAAPLGAEPIMADSETGAANLSNASNVEQASLLTSPNLRLQLWHGNHQTTARALRLHF
ncbi:hypothetical protein SBA7_300015 [Candidatus Sulfotelmatobacter sp. SbA7]|nr:hypothetical protein SBA7_300015 [Candidatus Sulfotelmatobacter sp. SbA7]